MPRIPKPYAYKGWYRTNAGGKRGRPLCRVEEGMTRAHRALALYLGRLAQAREEGKVPGPVGSGIRPKTADAGMLAGEVHDLFLDFKKSESEPLTYRHYLDKLKPFLDRFGHVPVASLTERDGFAFKQWLLTEKEWVKGGKKPGQKSRRMKGVGPTTCNHFLRAARTLLNWAAHPKRGYLPSNPWADVKLLKEKPRERLITDEEFAHLLREASDDDFRELLFFMRHTTARPGEVRQVEWDMVDWDGHRIRLDPRRVKTRRVRSFTLLPDVEEMLRGRQAEGRRRQGLPKRRRRRVGGREFRPALPQAPRPLRPSGPHPGGEERGKARALLHPAHTQRGDDPRRGRGPVDRLEGDGTRQHHHHGQALPAPHGHGRDRRRAAVPAENPGRRGKGLTVLLGVVAGDVGTRPGLPAGGGGGRLAPLRHPRVDVAAVDAVVRLVERALVRRRQQTGGDVPPHVVRREAGDGGDFIDGEPLLFRRPGPFLQPGQHRLYATQLLLNTAQAIQRVDDPVRGRPLFGRARPAAASSAVAGSRQSATRWRLRAMDAHSSAGEELLELPAENLSATACNCTFRENPRIRLPDRATG